MKMKKMTDIKLDLRKKRLLKKYFEIKEWLNGNE